MQEGGLSAGERVVSCAAEPRLIRGETGDRRQRHVRPLPVVRGATACTVDGLSLRSVCSRVPVSGRETYTVLVQPQ